MLKNYGDTNKLYGISQTRLILGLNIAFNDSLSGVVDSIKKTGNPPAMISDTLWARMNRTIAASNDGIPVKNGETYSYVTVPGTTSSHMMALNEIKAMVDFVTGAQDVLRGKRPTGVTAAKAMQALQEAAIVAVRLKLKNPISPFVEEIVDHQVEIIKEFDREIKNIRVNAANAEKHHG